MQITQSTLTTPPTMTSHLVHIRAAARYAGYSIRHFCRIAIDSGQLNVVKLGRKHFVVVKALDDWMVKRAS